MSVFSSSWPTLTEAQGPAFEALISLTWTAHHSQWVWRGNSQSFQPLPLQLIFLYFCRPPTLGFHFSYFLLKFITAQNKLISFQNKMDFLPTFSTWDTSLTSQIQPVLSLLSVYFFPSTSMSETWPNSALLWNVSWILSFFIGVICLVHIQFHAHIAGNVLGSFCESKLSPIYLFNRIFPNLFSSDMLS